MYLVILFKSSPNYLVMLDPVSGKTAARKERIQNSAATTKAPLDHVCVEQTFLPHPNLKHKV